MSSSNIGNDYLHYIVQNVVKSPFEKETWGFKNHKAYLTFIVIIMTWLLCYTSDDWICNEMKYTKVFGYEL